jgi:hypothetical protein
MNSHLIKRALTSRSFVLKREFTVKPRASNPYWGNPPPSPQHDVDGTKNLNGVEPTPLMNASYHKETLLLEKQRLESKKRYLESKRRYLESEEQYVESKLNVVNEALKSFLEVDTSTDETALSAETAAVCCTSPDETIPKETLGENKRLTDIFYPLFRDGYPLFRDGYTFSKLEVLDVQTRFIAREYDGDGKWLYSLIDCTSDDGKIWGVFYDEKDQESLADLFHQHHDGDPIESLDDEIEPVHIGTQITGKDCDDDEFHLIRIDRFVDSLIQIEQCQRELRLHRETETESEHIN